MKIKIGDYLVEHLPSYNCRIICKLVGYKDGIYELEVIDDSDNKFTKFKKGRILKRKNPLLSFTKVDRNYVIMELL